MDHLIVAVLQAPYDDDPRLKLADWAAENNDEAFERALRHDLAILWVMTYIAFSTKEVRSFRDYMVWNCRLPAKNT